MSQKCGCNPNIQTKKINKFWIILWRFMSKVVLDVYFDFAICIFVFFNWFCYISFFCILNWYCYEFVFVLFMPLVDLRMNKTWKLETWIYFLILICCGDKSSVSMSSSTHDRGHMVSLSNVKTIIKYQTILKEIRYYIYHETH